MGFVLFGMEDAHFEPAVPAGLDLRVLIAEASNS
jgi:hypothetical protein